MVEMAILLSLLVVLFLGITELGRALYFQHKLTKSAESAARFAGRGYDAVNPDCTPGTNWDVVQAQAAQLAVYASSAGGTVAVVPGFEPAHVAFTLEQRAIPGAGTACIVHVDIDMPYQGLFGDVSPLLDLSLINLTASSEERHVGE